MASLTQSNDPIASAINAVIANFEQAKNRFQQGMQQQRGNQLAGRALAALKTVPGNPIYPIRWTSDKQRKAFFASKGFGRGIPASRHNPPTVLEGWGAGFVATDEGGAVQLFNDVPYMRFVQGDRAQGFHLDTGYVQLDDVQQDAFAEMEGVAIQEWFEAADPLQGVQG
jgi:hypothetical protein